MQCLPPAQSGIGSGLLNTSRLMGGALGLAVLVRLRVERYGYTLRQALADRKVIERAVWGMLPKNRLGRQMLKKLKVYSGPNHPHAAQKAVPFEISQVSQ